MNNPHAVSLSRHDLVSDICQCGQFRRDHRIDGHCAQFIFSRSCTEDDLDRWVKEWYGTTKPTFHYKLKPKNKAAVSLGRKGGKANKGIPKPKSAENGKLGGRPIQPICGRCEKRHSRKQLNICDDGIASGDQREY